MNIYKALKEYKQFIIAAILFSILGTGVTFALPYVPTDQELDPTCAPGDTDCYVSIFPSQTSNTGKLLFTDGTNPAWASNLYWDETNDYLTIGSSTSPGYRLAIVGDGVFANGTIDRYTTNQTGPHFNLRKARGTVASPSSVSVSDEAFFAFHHHNGTSFVRTGIIITQAASVSGLNIGGVMSFGVTNDSSANGYPLVLNRHTVNIGNISRTGSYNSSNALTVSGLDSTSGTYTAQFHNSTGTSNSLVVRDDGWVGIGTASPEAPLNIQTYTTVPYVGLKINNNNSLMPESLYAGAVSNVGMYVGTAYYYNSNLYRTPHTSAAMSRFESGMFRVFTDSGLTANTDYTPTERMRITSAGLVGIGALTPAEKLHIEGTGDVHSLIRTTGASANTFNTYENSGDANNAWSVGRANNGNFNINHSTGSTYPSGTTNGRLTIDTTGRIGIGTTTPGTKLDVLGASIRVGETFENTALRTDATLKTGAFVIPHFTNAEEDFVAIRGVTNTTTNTLNFGGGTSVYNAATSILFWTGATNTTTGGTTRMIIDSTGNVGIGTATTTYQLNVGSSSIAGIVARFENSTGTCDINPTNTALICSSDLTLKKNINSIDSSLSLLTQLRPVTYNWNTQDDTTTPTPGFIAQEVETIFPFLVTTDTNTNLKSLNYTLFTPYIIKSIQELNTNLTSLDPTKPNTLASLIKEYLGDALNGLERLFVREAIVETLCVGTENDKTCITKSQLDTLLQGQSVPASSSEPEPETTPDPVEDEAEEPVQTQNDNTETTTDDLDTPVDTVDEIPQPDPEPAQSE